MVGCMVLSVGCTSTSHVGQMLARQEPHAAANQLTAHSPPASRVMPNSPHAHVATGMELEWTVQTDDSTPGVVRSGRSVVGPDGSIVLGPYGTVPIVGMSLEDASLAMEKQMASYVRGPKISLSTPIPANTVIAETPPQRPVKQVQATDKDLKAPTLWRPSTATVPIATSQPKLEIPDPFAKKNDSSVALVVQMPPPEDPLTGKKSAPKKDTDKKDKEKDKEEPEAPARLRPSTQGGYFPGDPSVGAVGFAPYGALGHRGGAPDELNRIVLPPYVIGPPDVLQVESLRGLLEQPIRGQHLVRPDGTIGVGVYGSVLVAGLTLDQARDAVARVIFSRLQDKKIKLDDVIDGMSVDVVAYNSKVYYVILDGAGLGEQVIRLPFTGNETVLDALSQVNGLPPQASKKHIWVARRCPTPGTPSRLDVNWDAVVRCGDTSTNWQIMPGDRVYVRADCLRRFDNGLQKVLSPIERLLGVTLLGSQTVNSIRNGNTGFNNGINR